MVQSMGRREQRTSRPIQTKPHLQAQNRKQQRTSSLKWTLTNRYSDCYVLYLCLSCHSTPVLSLFWDLLMTMQAAASLVSTGHQSASSTCCFTFSLLNTKVLHNINTEWTTSWYKSCEQTDGNCFLVALMVIVLKIVLFSISWAHLR